jgi:hypothetical protein
MKKQNLKTILIFVLGVVLILAFMLIESVLTVHSESIFLPIAILVEILVFWLLNKKIYKKETSIERIFLIVLFANLISSFSAIFMQFYIGELIGFLSNFVLLEYVAFSFLFNFVFKVLIEFFIFLIFLRKTFKIKDLLTICMIVNIFSYTFIIFFSLYLVPPVGVLTVTASSAVTSTEAEMETQFTIEDARFYQGNFQAIIKNVGTVNFDSGKLAVYVDGILSSYNPNVVGTDVTPGSTFTINITNTTPACGKVLSVTLESGLQMEKTVSC